MAVPSGYTALAKVGTVDRGTYSTSATYNKLDFVYYNGSSWIAQKDGLKGVTPAEGNNWHYFAKGFTNQNATGININDTSNLLGAGAGKATTLQKWGDKVADWLVNKVITNDNFVSKLTARLVNNGTTTNTGFALDARYGKTLTDKDASMQTAIDTLTRKTKIDENDTSWNQIYQSYCLALKRNGIVTVRGQSWSDNPYELPADTYKDMTTIPAKYRPSAAVPFTGSNIAGTEIVRGIVQPTGIVQLYSNKGTKEWIFSVSFVANPA